MYSNERVEETKGEVERESRKGKIKEWGRERKKEMEQGIDQKGKK